MEYNLVIHHFVRRISLLGFPKICHLWFPGNFSVGKINMTEFEKNLKIASGQRKWEMRWSRLMGLIKISIVILCIGSLWYSFIPIPHRDIDSNYDSSRRKDMKRY